MNNSDARRFGFCVRCLLPDASRELTEHHTLGRTAHPNQVVFVCNRCHVELHRTEWADATAYDVENEAMNAKTAMLVSSRALRFVIEHRAQVADGFAARNRNGVGVNMGPNGVEFSGHFGAVGNSGRRYYFVPLSNHADDSIHVEVFDATSDGVGGVGRLGTAAGGWVRFRGQDGGILGRFVKQHRKHASVADDLASIEQD